MIRIDGIFMGIHVILMVAIILLRKVSSSTNINNKTLHIIYLIVSILLLGLSLVVTLMFYSVVDSIGTWEALIINGPTILIGVLVIPIIKKSLKAKSTRPNN
jgi:hypothetical protein